MPHSSDNITYTGGDADDLPDICLEKVDVCCPGSDGGVFFPLGGDTEQWGNPGARAFLYLFFLLWCFLGVAIVADLFMGAIDQITSATKIKVDKQGKKQVTKVWNPTVANLSLMALGSSAPEILLNVIEITTGDFYAGELGPSTIVGSAAFNLLVILAVCVAAITEGVKLIKETKVYAITACTSIFAYIWLLIILIGSSPDIITIWEGVLTFMFFWILLFACYAADKNFFRAPQVAPSGGGGGGDSTPRGGRTIDAYEAAAAGDSPDEMTVKNTLKMANKMPNLDSMPDDQKVGYLLDSLKPVTVATHTRNAMTWLTGKKARPIFDDQTGQIKGTAHSAEIPASKAASSPAKDKSGKMTPVSPTNAGASMAKLCFKEEAVEIMEDAGSVTLVVIRSGIPSKTVSCKFQTADISATAGKDYEAKEGSLEFGPNEFEKTIEIRIHDDDRFEKAETFRVELKEPGDNAELDAEGNIAMVTIVNDDEIKKSALAVMQKVGNRDKMQVGMALWKKQFTDAMRPQGEDDGPAGVGQWVVHGFTVWFKVTFALVPPVTFGGGWPAFFVALGFIAIMTVFIGDLANFFGCVISLDPAITAITFVALGTSMPDTFASKAAAVDEPTADNSVGNVTGSNCVNVFLGLGLPWTIGAVYWRAVGKNNSQTAEWAHRYAENKNVIDFMKDHPGEAIFVVEAGSLGLSVIVFTMCAVLCLGTLFARRKLYGGELGGPPGPRYATAILFVMLWIVYVLISSFTTKGIIDFPKSSPPPSPPPSGR